MTFAISRRSLLAGVAACAAAPALAATPSSGAMQDVVDYVRGQKATGFMVVRDRRTLAEANWPLPADAAAFGANFTYGTTAAGALLEDVASQQKSFVAMLAAIAVDMGLLDIEKAVSDYIGAAWSKAAPEQERAIRVVHLLEMSSGLSEGLSYVAPAGSTFLYNTPAYAVTKRVLEAAAKVTLDTMTRDWLTAPAGMADTAWRKRPAVFSDVGNPTGLVTCPRDVAAFGQLVLDGGRAADGKRVVSEAALKAMFTRSKTNPGYGQLWWLNGSDYWLRPPAIRMAGSLLPAAPRDLVAALGALDRKLYVVPSLKLVVVRMGQAAPDKDFDLQLWVRLMKALS